MLFSLQRNIMFQTVKKIPEQYREEFLKKQISFIKTRVHLFCVLTVSIYFLAVLTGYILYPAETAVLEVLIGLSLVAGGALILYLNAIARTIRIAKLNAYLFTALLLVLLVKLGITYKDDALVSSSVFVFTIFLVSVTIPWKPAEVILIGAMHITAYTANFLYVKFLSGTPAASFGVQEYFDGFIFLSMALLLCLVIRRKETGRDVENFVLLKEVEDKNELMRKELEWATRIHKTIIPDSTSTDKVDIAVNYLPAYYIGGDYVKFEFLADDRLVFIISDVTGHGVPAALLVNRIHAEFVRYAKEGKRPGLLLKKLNEFIKEDFEGSDMYLSAFCGLLDFKEMQLLYSNYGHPPQYVYRAKESDIQSLFAQTSLLGLPVDDGKVYQSEIDVDKGDRIFLFTDGVTETVDSKGEQYGTKRLEDFLETNHTLSPRAFNDKLLTELNSYKDGNFKDDVCIMGIEIKCGQTLLSAGTHLLRHHKNK
ncbi:MAG: PP2C family protein-serine/threonine phosphatase [Candidatus Omnitrophota bacterium]